MRAARACRGPGSWDQWLDVRARRLTRRVRPPAITSTPAAARLDEVFDPVTGSSVTITGAGTVVDADGSLPVTPGGSVGGSTTTRSGSRVDVDGCAEVGGTDELEAGVVDELEAGVVDEDVEVAGVVVEVDEVDDDVDEVDVDEVDVDEVDVDEDVGVEVEVEELEVGIDVDDGGTDELDDGGVEEDEEAGGSDEELDGATDELELDDEDDGAHELDDGTADDEEGDQPPEPAKAITGATASVPAATASPTITRFIRIPDLSFVPPAAGDHAVLAQSHHAPGRAENPDEDDGTWSRFPSNPPGLCGRVVTQSPSVRWTKLRPRGVLRSARNVKVRRGLATHAQNRLGYGPNARNRRLHDR